MEQKREKLHVLCCEHHSQMRLSQILLKIGEKSWQMAAYVCGVPGCFVRYNPSCGYFITTQDGTQMEGENVPRISCPQDNQLMYLTEVRPQQRNYRLWRCPECNMSRTNEERSRPSQA
ncbi:MAG: hypothetical protein DMG32_17125 [Acidobacteria bacterium]|nr:MAG: hypothetical protein DMG32_17125 [Acidobacteriota bacterium]